jgi:glutamyl-tRNA reductase
VPDLILLSVAKFERQRTLNYLKIIAFTHRNTDLKDLGKYVICNELLEEKLKRLKAQFDFPELFYIGTCNRVEFVFCSEHSLTPELVRSFISALDFCECDASLACLTEQVAVYEGNEAMNHLLRVSCSLESMVVGEKEILAQVRKAYESAKAAGLTGDYLRLIMNRVVKTAKEVYTHTHISKKPISVVSLAYRKLRDLKVFSNARILLVGAGETNRTISKYLRKHKYSNFAVFNRTLCRGMDMAAELEGRAYRLEELQSYKKGFDVIITCTGATEPIITDEIYQSLLNGETDKKVIVDLAVPNDTGSEVLANNPVHFIDVKSLQDIAARNMQDRFEELSHAEGIIASNMEEFMPVLRQRRIELAMREVPVKIKEIKRTALNSVFAEEVQGMDESSRQVLEKVISYMEKKYISVPMVMAKEILVNNC